MRAVVITSNPSTATQQPDTPAASLQELGCDVVTTGYDLDDLPEDIDHPKPTVVVVDAGAHLEVGRASVKRLRQEPVLADIPVLLCIEVSRLPALDPEIGVDDFVLSPIVGPELYARVRMLDWRLSSFSSAGRIKFGDLVIDTVSVEAAFRGRPLKLPRQEFQLLKFLAAGAGRCLPANSFCPGSGVQIHGQHTDRGHPHPAFTGETGSRRIHDRDRPPRRLQDAGAVKHHRS